MRIIDYTPNSIVDGEGIRQVFWLSGCPHHCEECHNMQTWDFESGTDYLNTAVIHNALSSPFNVTFSGGEPLLQVTDLIIVCKALKRANRNIWLYTGYTWEEIMGTFKEQVLSYIDVLVDGRFIKELRDSKLLFRGSSNQRIIDVPKSLKNRRVQLWKSSKNYL